MELVLVGHMSSYTFKDMCLHALCEDKTVFIRCNKNCDSMSFSTLGCSPCSCVFPVSCSLKN
jgi:hypothetical protein